MHIYKRINLNEYVFVNKNTVNSIVAMTTLHFRLYSTRETVRSY